MRKSTIVWIVSACIAVIGVMLMGIEIFDRMDPDRIRIYAVITAVGLGGLLGCAVYRLRQREKKIDEMLEDREKNRKK